jgi:hypothetical protein
VKVFEQDQESRLPQTISVTMGAPFLARFVREKWGFSRTIQHKLAHPSQLSKHRSSKRIHRVILCLLLAFLTACSPRDYLTRRLATDLIAGSSEFQAQQRYTLQTGVVSNKDYPSPEYLVLQHHNWISANSAPCPAGMTPPPCWDIVLTPAGVETIRTIVSAEAAAKSSIPLPAARRELVAVTGVVRQGSAADVEFIWKWVPLNEIGAALYSGDPHYKSLVGFRQYDDGWRMQQGIPHSAQSIEDALKNAEPAP